MKPRLAGADVVDQYGQPRQESEDEADQLDGREIEQ